MKTAVEYYNQEIKELFNMHQDGEISGKMFHMSRLVALTKAKEMEKEQHQETWDVAHEAGRFEGKGIAEENWFTFEEYWELTFKSE